MKIAVVTDDGTTISQHFGRALYYLVYTVEDGKVASREQRGKVGHQHFAGEHHHEEHHLHEHGMGHAADDKHHQMTAAITDCEAVIARGMGRGAYRAMEQAHIRPIVTDIKDAEQAAQAYIDGSIVDHPEKLH